MENDNKKAVKKVIPIIIIFLLVAFIVAGTIICINSFSKNNEEITNQSNQIENTIPILNGTIKPNKGTSITLR